MSYLIVSESEVSKNELALCSDCECGYGDCSPSNCGDGQCDGGGGDCD